MSTIKVNQVQHVSGSSANITLDAAGNTVVNDLTCNTVTGQTLTLSNNLTVNGNTTIGNASSDTLTLNATVTGSSFNAGIIGEIRMYTAATAPSGWLLCDGSTIGNASSGATHAHANYSQLFEVVRGTSGTPLYGNTGSEAFASNNTVKLPDFKGRSPIGVGQQTNVKWNSSASAYTTSGTTFALSASGGFEEHKLTTAQISAHNHTASSATDTAVINDPGHRHGVQESQLAHTHTATQTAHSHAIATSADWASNAAGTGDPTKTAKLEFNVFPNPPVVSAPEYNTGYAASPGSYEGGIPFEPMDAQTPPITVTTTTPDITEAAGSGGFIDSATTGITDTGHNHDITVTNTGGDTPHNNLHPYIAVNFIIKY